MGTRCADHVTPLYPQKLALTSPTGGGRSVGIVRVRTKTTVFSLGYVCMCVYMYVYMHECIYECVGMCVFCGGSFWPFNAFDVKYGRRRESHH